jgi:hypothetical protein
VRNIAKHYFFQKNNLLMKLFRFSLQQLWWFSTNQLDIFTKIHFTILRIIKWQNWPWCKVLIFVSALIFAAIDIIRLKHLMIRCVVKMCMLVHATLYWSLNFWQRWRFLLSNQLSSNGHIPCLVGFKVLDWTSHKFVWVVEILVSGVFTR